MKLDDLTKNKLKIDDPLYEAARFGQREQGIVIKYADLFKIGVEYEFTVDEGVSALDGLVSSDGRKIKDKVMVAKREAVAQLQSWMQQIETIESDITVPAGAELVTRPLDLRSTLKMMRDVFQYIENIGGTDKSTGLHINVSMDGFNPRNFNAIKAAVLLDMTFKSSDAKFPARFLVEDIARELADDMYLTGLAKTHIHGGPKELIRRFENVLRRVAMKGSNVNMESFFDAGIKQKERRIEWRYIGGANYHKRYAEILNEILNICYVMLAGASDMLQKEYYQAIIRMLNRAADKKHSGRTFSDYIQAVKKAV